MHDANYAWHVRLKHERERLWPDEQAKAADAVGIGRSMLSRYENGVTEPGLGALTKLAATGVDVLYVLTGRRDPGLAVRADTTRVGGTDTGGAPVTPVERQSLLNTAPAPNAQGAVHLTTTVDGEERWYQVIEHITEGVCAGRPVGAAGAEPAAPARTTAAGPIAFEQRYMAAALGRTDDAYLSLTVEGDSMAPALLHGDLAVIDTKVLRVNVSGIYVLRFDGDLTIKRVTKRSDGSLVISSDNPQYARGDENFTRDQATTLQVIGRMVWPRVR